MNPGNAQLGSVADDRFHFVALARPCTRQTCAASRLAMKMARDGDDRRSAIKRPDLAFEIVLRRIHHGDMPPGSRRNYLGMLRNHRAKVTERSGPHRPKLVHRGKIEEATRESLSEGAEGCETERLRSWLPNTAQKGQQTDEHRKRRQLNCRTVEQDAHRNENALRNCLIHDCAKRRARAFRLERRAGKQIS